MTTKKQQAPLQKLITQWKRDRDEVPDKYDNLKGIYNLFIKEAELRLPEEKQMVIDAYYDGDEDCKDQNKRTGKEYFQEKYES